MSIYKWSTADDEKDGGDDSTDGGGHDDDYDLFSSGARAGPCSCFHEESRALDSCARGSNQRRQWGSLNCRSRVGDLSTCYESTSGPQAYQASQPNSSKSIARLTFKLFSFFT